MCGAWRHAYFEPTVKDGTNSDVVLTYEGARCNAQHQVIQNEPDGIVESVCASCGGNNVYH